MYVSDFPGFVFWIEISKNKKLTNAQHLDLRTKVTEELAKRGFLMLGHGMDMGFDRFATLAIECKIYKKTHSEAVQGLIKDYLSKTDLSESTVVVSRR